MSETKEFGMTRAVWSTMYFLVRLAGSGVLLFACGDPNRLVEPPPIGPLCAYEFEQCGFIDTSDIPCCGEGVCLDNVCYDPSRLTPPEDSCVAAQVDVAILLDRTGSMSASFDRVVEDIQRELDTIPWTTEVQVWDFPHQRDGDYGRSFPPGGPDEAAEAIELLPSPNVTHSSEASLDAVRELMTGGYWRYGSTLRLVIVVSDENPQSYETPRALPEDICDLQGPADRLVVYTRTGAFMAWDGACFETRNLYSIDIGSLIANPCAQNGGE